jgi:hypothetical protein
MVISRSGTSATSLYEMLTGTGLSAGTSSTGNGSKRLVSMVVTDNSTEDGGGAQTRTYGFVETLSLTEAEGDGGIEILNWSGVHHGNRPTIA